MNHLKSIQEENKEIFLSLSTNAFEFFERSIDEFENEPKYAIIHFCAAVETILKARLMREHWSLIAQKSDEITRKKFLEGDFKSVTMETSIHRLNNIACVSISDNAKNSFEAIAKERNKIIHFYNKNILSNKIKEELANKMYVAWFFISELLDEWRIEFIDFLKKINQIQRKMIEYKKYVKERFKRIEKEFLSTLSKDKFIINICHSCECPSMVFELEEGHYLIYGFCHVCNTRIYGVKIEREEEDTTHYLSFDIHNNIDKQGKLIPITEVYDCLKKDININKDYAINHLKLVLGYSHRNSDDDTDYNLANCTTCNGTMTVIRLPDDSWCCVECGDMFDRVSSCEWCNEQYVGEKDDTYLYGCGCGLCEGYAGWHADDKD